MAFMDKVYELLRGKSLNERNATGISTGDDAAIQQQLKPVVDENELITFVENEYQRRIKERLPFENQWKLNINFIEGNQHIDINPVSQSIEEIPKIFD